jgi:hypothetical protein
MTQACVMHGGTAICDSQTGRSMLVNPVEFGVA